MLYCISGIVGLQLNILLMCIKSVGRIAYYHRGHIALKHGSDWNIPMSEFHLATPNDEVDPGLAGDDLMSPDRT